jgi:hypothetical protein
MTKSKDVAHLYLGCDFVLKYKDGSGLSAPMHFTVDALAAAHSIRDKIDPILLLRPLSSMTDDEAIELVKLNEWIGYGDHPFEREYETYKNGFGQIVVKWGESPREHNVPVNKTVFTPSEFAWLLSHGFDMYELIKSGEAIEKEVHKA